MNPIGVNFKLCGCKVKYYGDDNVQISKCKDHNEERNTPNKTANHTPIPWKTNDRAVIFNGPWIANCHSGIKQAEPHPIDLANAAFIVRAVNSHEELLNTLIAVVRVGKGKTCPFCFLNSYMGHDPECLGIKAIAQAEGK